MVFLTLSGQDEKGKEFAENKQKAIGRINRMLMSTTSKERNRVVLSAGEKSFTLEEILKEIKEETKYGIQLIQILSKPRIRVPKKEEK